MEALREMFPAHPEHLLRQVWEEAGSIDGAIEALLQEIVLDEPNHGRDDSPAGRNQDDHIPFLNGENLEQDRNNGDVAYDKQQDKDPRPPTEEECILSVLAVIPDVCTDHVRKLYNDNIILQSVNIAEFIVSSLLEKDSDYPRKVVENPRKRKRAAEEEVIINKYEARDREGPSTAYTTLARKLLQQEFPRFYAVNIDKALSEHKFLAPTYLSLRRIELLYDTLQPPPFARLRLARKTVGGWERDKMSRTYNELVEELEYAKEKEAREQRNEQLEADAKLAVFLDIEEHEKTGMMMECQCCYDSAPFSGMTQCAEGHLFCLDCARKNAENEVGHGRYQLLCMAGCKAEFPRREILRFLSPNLLSALEKNEQEEVLRLAGLKDLVKCPFCDYAAICVPIEQDKEFRCENPECKEVSCRHCKLKTHIPKTCEEVAKEDKLSVRHAVEEAMTEALVRTCKKCGNKFIKEFGCNKMVCSRCMTLQCYVCSETISGYDHFNDPSRGGKATNKCPLFDNTEERHEEEVQKAAKAAIEKIRAENPDITEEDLEIKLSEAVKAKSNVRGRAAAAVPARAAQPPPPPPPPAPPRPAFIPNPVPIMEPAPFGPRNPIDLQAGMPYRARRGGAFAVAAHQVHNPPPNAEQIIVQQRVQQNVPLGHPDPHYMQMQTIFQQQQIAYRNRRANLGPARAFGNGIPENRPAPR